ncbi:uncharacterized protein N7473_004897 [Penicillium subrubescens]|nr:uncharacterized protein N7473_004897 [Penicillium subrubescens]KAJ5900827.1 hypothetical protein N7473_004897 [Penicillium subrubescens]
MPALQMETKTKHIRDPHSSLQVPGYETESSQDNENEKSGEDETSDREGLGVERNGGETFGTEQEEEIRQGAGEVLPDVGFLGGRAGPRADDKDTEESSERDLPGSEDYDSESSATESDEDAQKHADEALPDVRLIGGSNDDKVDDGDPEESCQSDLPGKHSETSDATHDCQGNTEPVTEERGEQEMGDAQQADDDDDGSSMDTASDISDRPQGIRSWIPNHVEEALSEGTSAQSVEPVEHWPPD